jgi:hypothetical protein
MAKLESAFDLAGKYVCAAAEIAVAEDHQPAHRPKEERDVAAYNSWVADPAVRIIGELEESFKKYPPIKLGTLDPYTAPASASR